MVTLTQWWVLREALHTHGLARDHKNNGSIPRFESLGVVLKLLARTTVDLLLELSKLAGNVSSVAVQHWGISLRDLTRVVQNDDLQENGYMYKAPDIMEIMQIEIICYYLYLT